MYQALYRKYRPTSFDDVVGQKHITDILRQEVASGRIAHAYLFTGSRGTGKTTCSKILAKAVNCPHQSGGNPCGVCDVCRGIDNGSITDVLEIDAASNNGVDNIRDLRAETNFTPASVKYRIYIIDEAHMLSIGAANALLKILEEPPEYVIFILATTELHKIPATILSRCQRFSFKRISPEVISQRVKDVASREDLEIDNDAADMIAKLADGGMRDALSLLDLCSGLGKKITMDTVIESAGLAGSETLSSLSLKLIEGNIGGAFEILSDLYENSIDVIRLCDQLIGRFRNLMIIKTAANSSDLIICDPKELEDMKSIADKTSLDFIFFVLDILEETFSKLSRSSSKKSELEMAIVKICCPDSVNSLSTLSARVAELEKKLSGVSVSDLPKSEPNTAKASSKVPSESAPKTPTKVSADISAPSDGTTGKIEPMSDELWSKILDSLAKSNPPLRAALTNSQAYVENDIIYIDSSDALFLRLIKENEYSKESLREAIKAETGKRYRLGPYNRKKQKNESEPLSPFQEISKLADEMGIKKE
ncbi:MAG: DNA polymerase III subunit gamma/tau [Oscillospiraceae bacterium]|nr:DNA polymerase III subunit gamma/tau [Oscillospiraceae bacterium]